MNLMSNIGVLGKEFIIGSWMRTSELENEKSSPEKGCHPQSLSGLGHVGELLSSVEHCEGCLVI